VLLHEKKAPLEAKELRVKIHVEYHLKLHALKLLRGKNMSEAVEEALDHYFQVMRLRDEDIPQALGGAGMAPVEGSPSGAAGAGTEDEEP
jgi:hypothetical protein